jgi:hypothetical protein
MSLHISHKYDTLVTVLFCLFLFYGADQIYQRLTKSKSHSRIKVQFDGLVAEVSRECHVTEEKIKRTLEQRYTSTRFRLLAQSVVRVFTPSKRQNNATMIIGEKRIEPRLIEEIPSDIRLLEFDEPEETEQIENVKIELHAQDVDRAKRGWAAVLPDISPHRLRMEIYPPITPEDIYTKPEVQGDIILVSRRGAVAAEVAAIDFGLTAFAADVHAPHLGRHRFAHLVSQNKTRLIDRSEIAGHCQHALAFDLIAEDRNRQQIRSEWHLAGVEQSAAGNRKAM